MVKVTWWRERGDFMTTEFIIIVKLQKILILDVYIYMYEYSIRIYIYVSVTVTAIVPINI